MTKTIHLDGRDEELQWQLQQLWENVQALACLGDNIGYTCNERALDIAAGDNTWSFLYGWTYDLSECEIQHNGQVLYHAELSREGYNRDYLYGYELVTVWPEGEPQ